MLGNIVLRFLWERGKQGKKVKEEKRIAASVLFWNRNDEMNVLQRLPDFTPKQGTDADIMVWSLLDYHNSENNNANNNVVNDDDNINN